jgi:membrane protein implicated in regulation of membrane protease activity
MDFLLRYEIWLIAAVIFVAVDVVVGLDFILLAFGIGAAVTGASLFWDGSLNLPYTSDWESLVTFFGIFSLFILVPLRILVKRSQKNDEVTDINHY